MFNLRSYTMATFQIKVSALKRKLNQAGENVKVINDQGRKAISDKGQVLAFRSMYDDLIRYYSKFESIWDELIDTYENEEKSTDFPAAADTNLSNNIKRYYLEAKANNIKLEQAAFNVQSTSGLVNTSNVNLTQSDNSNNSSWHLPPLPLPHFDGKMISWPKYRDAF